MTDRMLLFVDMDETLYPEYSYVMSGFRAVSAQIACDLNVSADAVYHFLVKHFYEKGRKGCLDALFANFHRCFQQSLIDHWVGIYREHTPVISLHDGVRDALVQMRRLGEIVVLTDGAHGMQERKFAALGLSDLVDDVVFCDAMRSPKPSPLSIQSRVEKHHGSVFMIGDRPDHDLALAAAVGIPSIRVRSGHYAKVPNAPWLPICDVTHIRDAFSYMFL